ncbi:MAG: hypothetical protein PHC41_09980 [Lachnospiraceae bacterium]|nr:hypothetical protein [Lachnospiraceae bacterium]MDD3616539.1 hypothetical protein [Lachnospiraceae bacterium]
MERTPYNEFLLEMQEKIPAMNVNGYMDKTGIFHSYEEASDEHSIINQYNILQYNELLDTGNKVDSFFSIDTKSNTKK